MSFDSYSSSLIRYPKFAFSLDTSLMDLDDAFLQSMQPKVDKAFGELSKLGLVEGTPYKVFGAQSSGCSPIATARSGFSKRYSRPAAMPMADPGSTSTALTRS